MRTEKSKSRTHEDERTEALHRDGITRSSEEVLEKRMERSGDVVEPNSTRQPAKGKHFINFSPAISEKASKAIRSEIRDWKLQLRS